MNLVKLEPFGMVGVVIYLVSMYERDCLRCLYQAKRIPRQWPLVLLSLFEYLLVVFV